MYSAQNKKVNGPEGAKYFSPPDGGHVREDNTLRRKLCVSSNRADSVDRLLIIGKILFASPGPLTFFF